MVQQQSSSIDHRMAVEPQQGRKVFTLQTLPALGEPFDDDAGKLAGFSLHARGRRRDSPSTAALPPGF